ncbi:bifunctional 5,10-methylenetetrahydrofolate dehydrogenase/5,10-methenyltetrahydrofolate cyclohydrolase [Fusobacterium sp.]|uniref:bifunctional 5,10-methylenetetrahydrofolate dehydrogenase/5,10-methenyltetrahydrofolate cyclohydrolase n=1 Tax=Fusobacterium sp. TaxID=68766 RepID=UPI00261C4547|nr:bifunctional 5,10-methylenetetrahydrofolate dehydrogenase/5,10-methenyltetrahydrofolate cyclohydrolase [Fusobacterium sp.]
MKCTELSNNIMKELKNNNFKKKHIYVVQVGNREDSNKYIKNKIKKCNELGLNCEVLHYEENEITNDILREIVKCYNVFDIPLFIQLPLPDHLDEDIVHDIKYNIDIDGFGYETLGRIVVGNSDKYPCTPKGIVTILENITDLEGKDVLIINRSFHIGKTLSLMLTDRDATVTVAHSKTKDLQSKIDTADIIVTAIGKSKYFNADNFKAGQIVIDVSINVDEAGKICGDIDKDSYDKLNAKGVVFTEVPYGVGAMTTTSLMEQIANLK